MLSLDDKLNFAQQTPFTISGWLKTKQENGLILSFRNIPEKFPNFSLVNLVLDKGKLKFLLRHAPNPFVPPSAESTSSVNDGKWHHFAFGRNTVGNLLLYVDGADFSPPSEPRRSRGTQSEKLITTYRILGIEALSAHEPRKPNSWEHRFVGSIDELRIYGDRLSDEKIRELAKPPE